jgi:hypothetical protein
MNLEKHEECSPMTPINSKPKSHKTSILRERRLLPQEEFEVTASLPDKNSSQIG